MPVTTTEVHASLYGDPDHWSHVMEHLLVPAVEAAGYKAERPVMSGSPIIQGQIVKQLQAAEMVLVDLSTENANVFWELGVRTALDRPVALIRDEHQKRIPFDLSPMNTHSYKSALNLWEHAEQQAALTQHLIKAAESCGGKNPAWQHFGLAAALAPTRPDDPVQANLQMLTEQLTMQGAVLRHLSEQMARVRERPQTATLGDRSSLGFEYTRGARSLDRVRRDLLEMISSGTLGPSDLAWVRSLTEAEQLDYILSALPPEFAKWMHAVLRHPSTVGGASRSVPRDIQAEAERLIAGEQELPPISPAAAGRWAALRDL